MSETLFCEERAVSLRSIWKLLHVLHTAPPGPGVSVQMLLDAFSRRMCCTRVQSAKRSSIYPCASYETPMRRPGITRL